MIPLTLNEALLRACAAVEVEPPKRQLQPGRWIRTDTLGRHGKDDGAVLIFEDERGGIVWNHQTAASHTFRVGEAGNDNLPKVQRDPRREREREAERVEVERVCEAIVAGCRQDRHPYLGRKGFPDDLGLVCDDPRDFLPRSRLGEAIGKALPEGKGPFLIIPGRINCKLTMVQFITPEGLKKNILKGQAGGAFHRISTGRETWVCEGIATAMSVRAALRLLGASATVLSAFSASNVGRVAEVIHGSRIAADNDGPVEALGNLGAGEFYARKSGRKWVVPPALGDFNDMHQSDGLRAVALHLRGLVNG